LTASVNYWTKKTLDLAAKGDYLDRLLEIYPAKLPPERPLPDALKQTIIDLYQKGKYEDLVVLLIDLKDYDYPFPIEHPYAALLRHLGKDQRSSVIKRNPQVVRELADLLVSLGLNNILGGIERPKDINRTLGVAFKTWVNKKFTNPPFRVVDNYRMLPRCSNNEICIYAGPDYKIAEFIITYLGLREPTKGFFDRDIAARVKDVYVICEARFLSTPGGSQSRDLDNTLRFVETMEEMVARSTEVKLKGVALLDGVVWFYGPYVEQIKARAVNDRVVMSVLFLEEYLLDLFNKVS